LQGSQAAASADTFDVAHSFMGGFVVYLTIVNEHLRSLIPGKFLITILFCTTKFININGAKQN
jgi:hypothetical protein